MIHLFYGDSAADAFACFNQVRNPIVLREALLAGPAALPSGGWNALRAAHLAEAYAANYEECLVDLQQFDEAIANLPENEELVCWFGRDLFCLIGLIYCLVRLSEKLPSNVSLVCPDSKDEDVYCFGDVAPAEMNDLLKARTRLERLDFQHAAVAWHLYADPDPRALNAVFDGSIDVGARFAAALELHASRFPSTVDGLGATERRVLMALRSGSRPFSELFQEVSKRMRDFGWGDAQVRNLCTRLAKSQPALVEINDDLMLTPDGEATLEGCGPTVTSPQYWLGGCELPPEARWQWDSPSRRIVYSGT